MGGRSTTIPDNDNSSISGISSPVVFNNAHGAGNLAAGTCLQQQRELLTQPGVTSSHSVEMLTSLLPHQVHAVQWMKDHEQSQFGGILADDMGLGKTLDCIALMVQSDHTTIPAPNLIICPKSLLAQWRDEIMAHTTVSFERILIYHGKRRQKKRRHHQHWLQTRYHQQHLSHHQQQPTRDVVEQDNNNAGQDVSCPPVVLVGSRDSMVSHTEDQSGSLFFAVIMTYDTVRAEYAQYLKQQKKKTASLMNKSSQQQQQHDEEYAAQSHASKSFLFDTMWGRIILDEAHIIRGQQTQITHAVMALHSKYRWCVTGTPYNNAVSDVASLCSFLRIKPYHSMHWWNRHNEDVKAIAQWREQCLLRRTKEILNLPSVEHVVVDCPLDVNERMFYDYLFRMAVQKYAQFQNSHQRNKLQMFGTMLSYLLRLRQACDHPLVVLGRVYTRALSNLSLSSAAAIENIQADQACVRCGCGNDSEAAAGIPLKELDCGHRICVGCDREMRIEFQQLLSASSLSTSEEVQHQQPSSSLPTPLGPQEGDRSCIMCYHAAYWKDRILASQPLSIANAPSTKIMRMLECIADARKRNPTSKVIVFSQWTTAMDVIENAVVQAGYGVVRYDGDVSNIDKRHHYVRMFKDDPQKQVFLGSLQAGGLGLNLTIADTVILYDSWYNPFAEDQAIDRVHRMGQQCPVRVFRLRCPNTVEDDVLRIQQRKRMASDSLFSEKRWGSAVVLESSALTEDDVHSIFKPKTNQTSCRIYSSPAITISAPPSVLSHSSLVPTNSSVQPQQVVSTDLPTAAACISMVHHETTTTTTTTTTTVTTMQENPQATSSFIAQEQQWSLWDERDEENAAAGTSSSDKFDLVLCYKPTSSSAASAITAPSSHTRRSGNAKGLNKSSSTTSDARPATTTTTRTVTTTTTSLSSSSLLTMSVDDPTLESTTTTNNVTKKKNKLAKVSSVAKHAPKKDAMCSDDDDLDYDNSKPASAGTIRRKVQRKRALPPTTMSSSSSATTAAAGVNTTIKKKKRSRFNSELEPGLNGDDDEIQPDKIVVGSAASKSKRRKITETCALKTTGVVEEGSNTADMTIPT